MAELIPIQYRIRVAQRVVLLRWAVYGAVILATAGVGVLCAWNWQRQQRTTLDELQAVYRERSPIIASAKEMKSKWQSLLERRQRIDYLRDDSTLLALLNHVSSAAREFDCLEQVQIDARKSATGEKESYFVRLTGVTADPANLAGLMKRLGNEQDPKINVILENMKNEVFLDGQVIRFHILCERPQG